MVSRKKLAEGIIGLSLALLLGAVCLNGFRKNRSVGALPLLVGVAVRESIKSFRHISG
jgi:hypothetical protein